jgi:putative membrane protein
MTARLVLALALLPSSALAHVGKGGANAWDPLFLGGAVLVLCAYLRGVARAWAAPGSARAVPRGRAAAFVAGWSILVLAVAPAAQRVVELSFASHMVEHEALMVAAAPLLVAARPLVALLFALPPTARRRLARVGNSAVVSRTWRALSYPPAAWALHALALWLWHMPAAFEAALASPGLHLLQHGSFFATALLFWWSLLHGTAATRHGAALASLFTTVLHTSVLGALLAIAPRPWYRGIGLADQQLAGILMWVPGGLVYVGVALWLALDWLRVAEARTRRWERGLGDVSHVG